MDEYRISKRGVRYKVPKPSILGPKDIAAQMHVIAWAQGAFRVDPKDAQSLLALDPVALAAWRRKCEAEIALIDAKLSEKTTRAQLKRLTAAYNAVRAELDEIEQSRAKKC